VRMARAWNRNHHGGGWRTQQQQQQHRRHGGGGRVSWDWAGGGDPARQTSPGTATANDGADRAPTWGIWTPADDAPAAQAADTADSNAAPDLRMLPAASPEYCPATN
jgi:hypothetical protein